MTESHDLFTSYHWQSKLTAIIQSRRTYSVWAHCAHEWQCRCQEDPVSLPSGGLEKTTRASPHHMAEHRPTGSGTPPPYAPRSSRFGSEPPFVVDDVDVWRYAILQLHTRSNDDDYLTKKTGRTGKQQTLPVPFGGPAPTYSDKTCPLLTSAPGMLATHQWCHSRNFGSARLGASGSTMQTADRQSLKQHSAFLIENILTLFWVYIINCP